MNNTTNVTKDLKEKSILVSREFTAPVETVWNAYTDSKILDKWWGPSPWRAETKSMDFRVGGFWLYAMVGPENEKHWGRMNYLAIEKYKFIDLEDVFCDENGNVNSELPNSKGRNSFAKTNSGTLVEFKLQLTSEEQLKQLVEMGFEEGITICFEQLNELINTGKI